MPESRSLSLAEDPADDRSYDLIEKAMMESVRGRRFLAEFVRRHRSADTTMLLDAMSRLEHAVARDYPRDALARGAPDPSHGPRAAPTASIPEPNSLLENDAGLGALAPAARQATADLLGEAETLQDVAWRLRESGAATKLCAELDGCAKRMYVACSSQEALAQQTASAVKSLNRLQAQASASGARTDPAAISRQDRSEDRHPRLDAERLHDLAHRFRYDPADFDADTAPSLEDLDRLTIEERLALFC